MSLLVTLMSTQQWTSAALRSMAASYQTPLFRLSKRSLSGDPSGGQGLTMPCQAHYNQSELFSFRHDRMTLVLSRLKQCYPEFLWFVAYPFEVDGQWACLLREQDPLKPRGLTTCTKWSHSPGFDLKPQRLLLAPQQCW